MRTETCYCSTAIADCSGLGVSPALQPNSGRPCACPCHITESAVTPKPPLGSWQAVLADGSRITIAVRRGPSSRSFAAVALDEGGEWHPAVIRGECLGATPATAAHKATEPLLDAGIDVRDLVPAGCMSRAELAEKYMAAKGEATARGRFLLALIDTLPKCETCGIAATRAWDQGTEFWCDAHSPSPECPDYNQARATALRGLRSWVAAGLSVDGSGTSNDRA